MVHQIKILKGITPILVGKRELRTSYVTGTEIKSLGFMFLLKSMTTAGQIKNYPKQLKAISAFCKCSKGTFYTRLYELVQMGLVKVDRYTIHLASFKKIAEHYELPTIEFHLINYDTEDKGKTIEYILKTVEIAENQQRQQNEVQRKINKTPEIELAYNSLCRAQNKPAEFTLKNLHTKQRETYSVGADDYDVLHSINPDLNRSAKSIKKAYGHVSVRNVAYLKRQLNKRGLATVTKRVSPIYKYPNIEPKQKERGKTLAIGVITALIMPHAGSGNNTPGNKKGRMPKNGTSFYDKKNRCRLWRLTDDIEPNQQLFN